MGLPETVEVTFLSLLIWKSVLKFIFVGSVNSCQSYRNGNLKKTEYVQC